jgi:hypothetical protein
MLKKFFKSYIILVYCALFTGVLLVPAQIRADAGGEKLEIKPLYIFRNISGRDPFSPRYMEGKFPAIVSVDITVLKLLGITRSGNVMTALFKSKSGSNFGYIFTGGKLYGDNDALITGIAGEFKSDTEIMLRQGDIEMHYKLDADPAGSPDIIGRESNTTNAAAAPVK